ncbi:class II peroxidase [Sporormia fimetaria CBS 119925]|uniref:Peroxidase n=1 Tax=Sporormia fimetaria CBS 119925 TaxID=1340428 RepID=A0A6A6V434_9PLEO|nr:class II peroxidase [Sporormia fimetaria CBS 119925]
MFSSILLAIFPIFLGTVQALTAPVVARQSTANSCPIVWTEISTTLTQLFLAEGQCTDAARAAIRAAFHDCFNGACDGSLILANECSNTENRGLVRLCDSLGSLARDKGVGVADLIQFAAAHAIRTCPGGPAVPVSIGRKDSNVASPMGILPSPFAPATALIDLFASKGFSVTELVALIGAHSTARQFSVNASLSGAPLDSSPGRWDTQFYAETKSGRAPFTLPADKALAESSAGSELFELFAESRAAWASAFVPAMVKLSVMGVYGDLVDCSEALPGGTWSRKVRREADGDRREHSPKQVGGLL